jgi:hypothetical protein
MRNRFCVNADAGRACPLLIVRVEPSNNACLAFSRPGSFNRRRSVIYWHIRPDRPFARAWERGGGHAEAEIGPARAQIGMRYP